MPPMCSKQTGPGYRIPFTQIKTFTQIKSLSTLITALKNCGEKMIKAVSDIYYLACFKVLLRAHDVEFDKKSYTKNMLKGKHARYDLWITSKGEYHCSCAFIRYQSVKEKTPCKHIIQLAIDFLLHIKYWEKK